MTISDNSLFTQQLAESGHLIERETGQKTITPLSNTGLYVQQLFPQEKQQAVNQQQQAYYGPDNPNRFSARIHWLQGTFSYSEGVALRVFASKLEELFNDTFEWDCGPFTSGKKFDDSARSANGIILAWQRPDEEKLGRGWISFPGSVLDRLLVEDEGETMLVMLFHLLETGSTGAGIKLISGWKTTCLDTTVDDFEKKMRPKDLLPYAEAGDYTGFRFKNTYDERSKRWLVPSWAYHKSPASTPDGQLIESGTLAFGSAQSDKRLTIYDKFAESNGAIDSVRWEARWRDDYAQVRFEKICTYLFESDQSVSLGNVIAAITMGAIEFIDRSTADRACRSERASFWSEMLMYLGRIKIPISAPRTYLEKTVSWIVYQVATSLAVLQRVSGFENLMNALLLIRDNGFLRLRKNHETMIEQGQKDKFDVFNYVTILLSKNSDSSDMYSYDYG